MGSSYNQGAACAVQYRQTAPYPFQCPNTAPGALEQYPVGMGYVPWQQWQQTYPLDKAFERGTIFPDLDLPFVMRRCN